MMRRKASWRPVTVLLAAITAAVAATEALAFGGPSGVAAQGTGGVIEAVGAENQYANVIAQVGGQYVRVTALLRNPRTDPYTFVASIAAARQGGDARLVVQNGLGYDAFMNTIEDATPSGSRVVIDVRRLLKLPDRTPNPHLWYDPATMPKVAREIARDLSAVQPQHARYFTRNADAFVARLAAWNSALAAVRAAHGHAKVASTEPVADYLLRAAGVDNLTPWTFQADIMNGVDPSPQDIATVRALLDRHQVTALVCNKQVTNPLTESLIALADRNHIPVVGVYETMPEPGYDYQSWMLAETTALRQAIEHHTSAEHL